MGIIVCDIVEITDESESYGRNVGGFSALAVIPFTFFQNSHLQTPHSLQNKKECLQGIRYVPATETIKKRVWCKLTFLEVPSTIHCYYKYGIRPF
jgi:hypothetical protein